MSVLLMVLGAFLVYIAQKWLYITQWKKDLDVRFEFLEESVIEGETAHMRETLTNRKRLPMFTLQVKFAVPAFFNFEEKENTVSTDRNYRNDIYVLNGFEKVTRTLPFTCTRRGYYTVQSLELISSDLFHRQKLAVRVPQNGALYVYPRTLDRDRFDILFRELLGAMITRRYSLEDPFEFRGIRPYEPGDPMRQVNWKISARQDELMVNQYQFTASQHVCILLNLESDSNWRYDKLFEESIRLAAAYIECCMERKIPVSLRTNARDVLTGEQIEEKAGSGEGHGRTMIRALSRIDEKAAVNSFSEILHEELASLSDRTTYVMISYTQQSEKMELYDALCSRCTGSICVVPLHPDMAFRAADMEHVSSERWEVPYA